MEIRVILFIILGIWSITSFLFNIIFVLFLEGEGLLYSNSRYIIFWNIIWNLESLTKINNFGKIIVELLYTIFSLPFLITYNVSITITYIVEYLIVKPFSFIFKRRKHGSKN